MTRAMPAAAAVSAALIAGGAIVYRPVVCGVIVAAIVVALAIDRLGRLAVATLAVGTLPWLVVFGELLPPLVKTIVAAIAAASYAFVARPQKMDRPEWFWLRTGIVCLFVPAAISIARDGTGAQLIQVAKYLVFPTMVLAVVGASRRDRLAPIRSVLIWSAAFAVTIHVTLGLAGLGSTGTKYRVGEVLGFANAHDVALLSASLVAGAVVTPLPARWRVPMIALGADAAVLTGVRSAVVGLVVVALGVMVAARMNPRAIAVIAAATGVIFLSGADKVIVDRFDRSQQRGEFSSFVNYGSGRGAIYDVALQRYASSGPGDWIFGTGLRSIQRFESEELGGAFVGHSDIVEVLVQLGIVGLVGLAMIWFALIRCVESTIPLLPVLAFAIFNGSLEYAAPIVVAVAFTAGLRLRAEPARAVIRQRDAARTPLGSRPDPLTLA